MADAHPLMKPWATGFSSDPDQMRPEFRYSEQAQTIDAPELIPTGGCINWTGQSGTIYLQPHYLARSYLEWTP